MIRPGNNVAMVLAHGNHELFAAGLIQQFQPDILYITRGRRPEDERTEEQARSVLKALEFGSKVTFLPVRETDIYGRLLARDAEWFATLRNHVAAWLYQVGADAVITDAFEWYNSVHDLCSLLVDAALETSPLLSAQKVQRYDLPLAFQTIVQYDESEFVDTGIPHHRYTLDAEESRSKRDIIQKVIVSDQNVREVVSTWTAKRYEQEIYQPVPSTRDYGVVPPRNQWVTYDDYGKENVARGRYPQAITFQEHYAPIAVALFDGTSLRSHIEMERAA